jgi:phosphopantothenoylcysteine decarboxylase/phosphopantothenate--cysteine ligase
MLKGKKILIGVTGSIAAYKIPLLVRLLVREGAEVKIIVTEAAKDFVTPLTLSTLSGNPVLSDFFDARDGSWTSHVELGHWADAFLLAPVSANTMAKMANGNADNLLVATYLAAKCPVLFAPAMDVDMFNHPSTQKNIQALQSYGNILLEPETGELASGLTGAGRLQEPDRIFEFLKGFFQKKKEFNKLKVLVTAGPTYEPIDPVRFIGNYSSGKMGYAIADAFAEQGAEVSLVSGPVTGISALPRVKVTHVQTSGQMYEAVTGQATAADIIVMAAAVADFTPDTPASKKIKKEKQDEPGIRLSLRPTRDILATLGQKKGKKQILVGFALETDNELANAQAKLKNKNLDLIVLNSLREEGAGFGHATNKVTILDRKGGRVEYELKDKKAVARDLLDRIALLIDR